MLIFFETDTHMQAKKFIEKCGKIPMVFKNPVCSSSRVGIIYTQKKIKTGKNKNIARGDGANLWISV